MALKIPRTLYNLLSVMSRQEPQSRFQNEGKRSRGCIKNRQQQMQVKGGGAIKGGAGEGRGAIQGGAGEGRGAIQGGAPSAYRFVTVRRGPTVMWLSHSFLVVQCGMLYML